MDIISKDGVVYLEFRSLKKYPFIKQAISTRIGGVSRDEGLESMNLGTYTRDTRENVQTNYTLFCNSTGFNVNNLVLANQTHSINVRYATPYDMGKGIFKDRDYNDVDALITDHPNLPLVIHTADCVPVLFADTVKKVIGAAHCGWKGTYGELSKYTLEAMNQNFGTNPEDVVCTIGPCICCDCYEVSEDLFKKFRDKFGNLSAFKIKSNSFYIDLAMVNRHILTSCGVNPDNIEISDLCTSCNKDLLYSHRGLGPQRGIFASIIQLV